MNSIVLGKKKYVVIPEVEYNKLMKKALLKTKPEKTYSIEEARAMTDKLIDKWFKEK